MSPYPTVIAGTDGSATATRAVRQAALLASGVGARLLVVTAYLRTRPEEAGPPSVRAESPQESAISVGYRAAAETAQDGAAAARAAAGDLSTDTAAVQGEASEALLRVVEAHPGSLLVIGDRGMTGSQRFVLGSVPNKVTHHAVGDVLLVHTADQRTATAYRRLLATTDGSARAERALARTMQLAGALNARVDVLSVGPAATTAPAVAAGGRIADAHGVAWHGIERTGDAAEEIVAAAASYDLIIVGNRGMTGTERFLLGNVPNKVSHHSPTDLLIVKTG